MHNQQMQGKQIFLLFLCGVQLWGSHINKARTSSKGMHTWPRKRRNQQTVLHVPHVLQCPHLAQAGDLHLPMAAAISCQFRGLNQWPSSHKLASLQAYRPPLISCTDSLVSVTFINLTIRSAYTFTPLVLSSLNNTCELPCCLVLWI